MLRKEPSCVVHFYHTDFKRCKVMHQHLTACNFAINVSLMVLMIRQTLSHKYIGTRFIRVFVENVPFLVEKLGIKVLPCVIAFNKGVSSGRYVSLLVLS